ncbi:hydroxymethylpyrimidine/phosphomethylpyrimidine kinase [Sporothrix brasiliensis 5110]|uniref:Hydroxymethylpyrimidine/phosphomethylpyrimidine kinase n=1 Tax=Sporothrix brasiliensis 5110 TaxID=1398154 RepID=A0A0C2FNW2_9PEZI|nr:hydroxymethylpyrimidine/phosphomethylpyrimidine kinase [Sporothrix brasiliensis 5110]KIH92708.1 hydroxymethylpyrimidine/phosphomethylpyrimidine kinase [Sporothrix brasiliensis 5110]
MLASAETIKLVADTLEQRAVTKSVIDPVMVATTGATLLPPEALADFGKLARLAYVLTPNIPELKLLLGCKDEPIETVADLERLARLACDNLGSTWVLAKGGHTPFKADYSVAKTDVDRALIVNVLAGRDGQLIRIESQYQDSKNTHGTGCSLASAIASNLATGLDVEAAARAACRYVDAAIRHAPRLGKGHGPLNHFHSLFALPFSRGHFLDYVLERPDVVDIWHQFVNHPFVKALGAGTLPRESFKGYLTQDYLYLVCAVADQSRATLPHVHFARAGALAAYKSKNMPDIVSSAALVQGVEHEMQLHLKFCADFGLTKKDMEATEENIACTAYSRYILDIGHSEDWFALQVALAPCVLGYGVAARALHQTHATNKDDTHPYWKWVENYTNDDYGVVAKATIDKIERHAVLQSASRIEELIKIFKQAIKVHINPSPASFGCLFTADDVG